MLRGAADGIDGTDGTDDINGTDDIKNTNDIIETDAYECGKLFNRLIVEIMV